MTKLKYAAGISIVAIFLASCGGSDSNEAREKQIEDTAAKYGVDVDVTLDTDGETERIVINQGGAQIGQGLDLPSGFPDDIKLPGSWNIMAASAPMPNGYSIQALSDNSASEVMEELRSRMIAEGWVETAADTPTPHMSRISFEKDDRMANFNILENGETRAVQLLTTPKP